MNDFKKSLPLQEALTHLQEALLEWDQISDTAESEAEAFKKKTRELLVKLSEQLKALDL